MCFTGSTQNSVLKMPAQLRLPGLRYFAIAGSFEAIWKPRPNLSLPAPSGKGMVRCLSASGWRSTKIDPIAFWPIIFTDAGVRIFAEPSVPSLSSIRTNFA